MSSQAFKLLLKGKNLGVAIELDILAEKFLWQSFEY